MTKIVQLHTNDELADQFFNSSKSKAMFQESNQRMEALIENPEKSERAKLEAKMVIALNNNDDAEFEKIVAILERLNTTGITIIK